MIPEKASMMNPKLKEMACNRVSFMKNPVIGGMPATFNMAKTKLISFDPDRKIGTVRIE